MFLHDWKGLLVAGEQEKPEPSSVSEIACPLGGAGQPLTPLLALDEDLSTPRKHADAGALKESGENYCVGEFRGRIAAVAGRTGNSSAKIPPYST